MGLFFGTDGVRGVFDKTLTIDIAYHIGLSLSQQKSCKKIIIGQDTRLSGNIIKHALCLGLMRGGVKVVDVGICPTAGISYLTTTQNFDYGIIVTASHNSSEYNGIKIFGSNGEKIDENIENNIEKNLFNFSYINNIGTYVYDEMLIENYIKFLKSETIDLSGYKIVLDCANGAAYKIAEKIFKDTKADVIVIGNKPNGTNINEGCGVMHIDNLVHAVKLYKADMGFAFDGDSDRVLAVDEKGDIVNGDKIIYLFAIKYKAENKLNGDKVVCTHMTNLIIENELKKFGIKMQRTDVGDKYIVQALDKENLIVGGEECGHIFLKDKLTTGDGILNAINIAKICREENKKLSEFFNFKLNIQIKSNIKCSDKNNILKCKELQEIVQILQDKYKNNFKIIIRPSGTEEVIRVLVEAKDKKVAESAMKKIEEIINKYQGDI